jgi:flagellar hook-associated protein 3 FlgL
MRVTANIATDSLVQRLQMLGKRQLDLQSQAASGQKIRTADNDAAGIHRVLTLAGEAQAANQFQDNIARHQERATATFTAVDQLKKVLDRAQEIAILSDGLTSPEEMQTYASEVRQLLDRALQLANSKHGEEFLFSGTRGLDRPFIAATAADGSIESVAFNGSSTLPGSEISPGNQITSHIAGANPSADGARGLLQDSRYGVDFFGHLVQLRKSLESGDPKLVLPQSALLKADEENFLFHITANGALQSSLQVSDKMAQSVITNSEQGISREADADLAETLMQLNQTQTAYQIALQSSAKTMDLSLLDFLR